MTADWVPNKYDGPSVAFDFDGTLNYDSRVFDPGPPRYDMVALVNRLYETGWYVVVHSARPPTHHPRVVAWLNEHRVCHHQVALGTKPSTDAYVDDKGLLPPVRALHEWLERKRQAHPMEAIARGISPTDFAHDLADCHENPEWSHEDHDASFRVLVPVSGGMDSTTAWGMAKAAGLPVVPVYVNTGAAYSRFEIATCRWLMGDSLLVEHRPMDYVRYGYVDLGRNAIIIWHLAELMRREGWWGGIWFGNVAEWAETPIRGGDKCHRFFADMQHLLTIEGHDVHLESPLGGMTKADCVRWWQGRGGLATITQARSCYDTSGAGHCGRCRSCFRRWLAFTEADVDVEWPNGFDFDEQLAEYRETARTTTSMTMDPQRTRWVDTMAGVTS